MKSLLLATTLLLGAHAYADEIMPGAQYASGICQGLRAEGTVNPHRPIAVTLRMRTGSPLIFRCPATAAGWLRPPVSRTVQTAAAQ